VPSGARSSHAGRICPRGGAISRRRLLSIEGAGGMSSKTLFDVLLPVCFPLPRRARGVKIAA